MKKYTIFSFVFFSPVDIDVSGDDDGGGDEVKKEKVEVVYEALKL